MVLGAFGVWWFKFASDEVKARIEETMAPLMGGLSSAWRLLVEGAMRLKERMSGESTLTPVMCKTKHLHLARADVLKDV